MRDNAASARRRGAVPRRRVRVDAYHEHGLNAWRLSAVALIAAGAGARLILSIGARSGIGGH
ncbi:hypothetical protein IU459_24995 [Nocardia amamiensis]|uniref:Uncharacterized protein n=1 Tax=Nocardia amamiensis TaxID=404578 RepID=A0ABS0CVY7_9NOCA|nr:hypothetical protein [Nocardia amamiensis]